MPRWIIPLLVLLALLALLPLAWVARARVAQSGLPRIHVVPDMDNQGRFERQQANDRYVDGRSMRLPVEGTVARGQLRESDSYYRGMEGEEFAAELPDGVAGILGDDDARAALLARGRERFELYCAPCHGVNGDGEGVVAQRAAALMQGTWVPPSSLHMEPALSRPPGHVFNTITNGIRTMRPYGSQVPVDDRWAIVVYIDELRRSQQAAAGE
jgi:mono/diheme cytochrome c family protein